MGRSIKINCKKVYLTGNKYNEEAEKIKNNQVKLKNIKENIAVIWSGIDSEQFQNRFLEHIDGLDDIVSFLNEEADILKGNATGHGTVDNDFRDKTKRSDILDDQYKYRY